MMGERVLSFSSPSLPAPFAGCVPLAYVHVFKQVIP